MESKWQGKEKGRLLDLIIEKNGLAIVAVSKSIQKPSKIFLPSESEVRRLMHDDMAFEVEIIASGFFKTDDVEFRLVGGAAVIE